MNDRKIVGKIIKRYFKGEYPVEIEQQVRQWLVDSASSTEKDCALREQWDKLQVEHDDESLRASYDKMKRILGFDEV